MTTRVKATYEVKVDLDGDRLFADASGDISAYQQEIHIKAGFRKAGDRVSRPAKLTLVLDNTGGQFSPEGGSALSGFTKGRAIRVRMTYDATTVQLYSGRIDHIKPQVGTRGPRRTTIRCDGYLDGMLREEVSVEAQQDKTADQLITAVLSAMIHYPPTLIGWFLGMSGYSELGVTTTLKTGPSDYASLETGVKTFDYAGDNWRDGMDVYRALTDIVLAEGGWLYEDPADGQLHFWNRHHLFNDLGSAADATLTGAVLADADYDYGEGIINDVELTYNPRDVGDSLTDTLGTLDSPVLVRPGAVAQVILRFDDGSGNRISALSTVMPRRTDDFTANSAADGSGTDYTGSVDCTMNPRGDKAELFFKNFASVDVYIQSGARVRGQKLTDFGQQVVRATDDASILSVGRYPSKKHLTMLEDPIYAQNLAQWVVGCYGNPTGNFRTVTFLANGSSALMAHARDRRIGDKVALSEQHTGASGEYFIMGLDIDIVPGRHDVTWLMETIPAASFWSLGVSGYSELGVSTIIGL